MDLAPLEAQDEVISEVPCSSMSICHVMPNPFTEDDDQGEYTFPDGFFEEDPPRRYTAIGLAAAAAAAAFRASGWGGRTECADRLGC